MEKKYLLPELKKSEAVTTNECWENIDYIYDYLLDNLKLYYEPSSSIFDGDSSAYPHIFEQMLLFHEAFLDRDDPDHDRAVSEWRACLAIMALQRIKNVKLDMIKVDFQNSQNTFLKAAAYFLPEDTPVFYQTTWDFIYVLCMDGEPIALLSPVTLICPAKQFRQRIQSLTWVTIEKRNGIEELDFDFKGRGNEYSGLTFWLEALDDALQMNSSESRVEAQYRRVKKELKNYIRWTGTKGTAEYKTQKDEGIYPSMNKSNRKEYQFFNWCCDFNIRNIDLQFLKRRYHEDIFQENILVLVYDDSPSAGFQSDNLDKLEALFEQIPQIRGKRLVAVVEPGGESLPMYVFLPFKDSFVNELIHRRLRSEDMLEECQIEFIQSMDVIDIHMQIKEFPYSFEKRYPRSQWKYIYGKDLAGIYLWPGTQINDNKWKAYYIFFSNEAKHQVSVPDADSVLIGKTETSLCQKEMYVVRSAYFPLYIKFLVDNVSAYLPIKANDKAKNQTGKTAVVFIHIGHTMTYVDIIGEKDEGKIGERLGFQMPKSLRFSGDKDSSKNLAGYFIPPEKDGESNVKRSQTRRYFKNMLHSFWANNKNGQYMEARPIQDGQLIFDTSTILHEAQQGNVVSFFDFEYYLMHEEDRRNVHLFLEEILLYAAHQAACLGYTYMRVNYLYCMEDRHERLGQLQGLWTNAFQWVKQWTGIEGHITRALGCMDEQRAMAYLLYQRAYQDRQISLQKGTDSKEKDFDQELYVGVDIGWSKTLVCLLNRKKENGGTKSNELESKWSQIDFAGRNISMLEGEIKLANYPEILSIFLRGSDQVRGSGADDELLREFGNLYHPATKNREYYMGLFDVIAMRIEEEGFRRPPDVYYRKQQFRAFLEAMSYNVFLLFLNVGSIIGKMVGCSSKQKIREIHLFLSGNGAKFLKWISTVKEKEEINEQNGKQYFICRTNESLPEIVRKGFAIGGGAINEELSCKIEFFDSNNQLIDGYIFKEFPKKAGYDSVPEILLTEEENTFAKSDAEQFCSKMEEVKRGFVEAIFQQDKCRGIDQENRKISEVIRSEAESVGIQLAEAIQKMGSWQE